jgi:hypothetical protein
VANTVRLGESPKILAKLSAPFGFEGSDLFEFDPNQGQFSSDGGWLITTSKDAEDISVLTWDIHCFTKYQGNASGSRYFCEIFYGHTSPTSGKN